MRSIHDGRRPRQLRFPRRAPTGREESRSPFAPSTDGWPVFVSRRRRAFVSGARAQPPGRGCGGRRRRGRSLGLRPCGGDARHGRARRDDRAPVSWSARRARTRRRSNLTRRSGRLARLPSDNRFCYTTRTSLWDGSAFIPCCPLHSVRIRLTIDAATSSRCDNYTINRVGE